MSNDWYSDFVNSGFGKAIAGQVGLHERGRGLLFDAVAFQRVEGWR